MPVVLPRARKLVMIKVTGCTYIVVILSVPVATYGHLPSIDKK